MGSPEFLRRAPFDATEIPFEPIGHLADAVRAALVSGPGVVVIRGFPLTPDDLLAALARTVGRALTRAVTAPAIGDVVIHDVGARDRPLQDRHGEPVLSTTSEPFACHSDDFFAEDPADVVMLLCARPARHGGDSRLVRVDDIVDRLDPMARSQLSEAAFPTQPTLVPILTDDGGRARMRYNRREINSACATYGIELTAEQISALNDLDELITQLEQPLRLGQGDCMILDNWRVLHGRTAFPRDSDRLMRRVKCYL